MPSFCPICGKEIPEAAVFCPFCSADVNNPSSWQDRGVPRSVGMSGKMKVLILLVIVVSIVVVSVFMFLFMFGDSLSEGDFVGSWDVEMTMIGSNYSYSYVWSFDEDGTLEMINVNFDPDDPYDCPYIYFDSDNVMNTLTVSDLDYYSVTNASWEIDDGKLCINPVSGPAICFDYEVNGDTVELTGGYGGYQYVITMDNRGDEGFCSYVVQWEDINITIEPEYVGEVKYSWITLTRVPGVSYSGSHAPSEWGDLQLGDVIQIADMYTSVSMTGRVIWVPNGEMIDWFSV